MTDDGPRSAGVRGGLLSRLETRVPPPVWFLLHALALLGLDALTPGWRLPAAGFAPAAALGIVAVALFLDVWAIVTFLRARTTVNPLMPERASRLVTHGPYRLSRNPMYLGLLLWLLALGTWRTTPWVLPVGVLFVVVITRLQILPEERLLAARFGAGWREWSRQVRRWL